MTVLLSVYLSVSCSWI